MKYGVFDIEAKDWTKFEIMGFFDGVQYQEFYGVPHFLDVVLSRKYSGFRFYAHFAGRYDFLFILQDLLERDGYQVKILEAGSRLIQLCVKKGKHSWYFQDSWALLQSKLDDLTKAFGVKYKKLPFDHEKGNHLSKEGREYLKHDVLGLYEVLEKYAEWGKNDGVIKITAASQALYIFRKNFLDERLFRLNDKAEEFIRKTYFGGRVEIFKMYGQNLNYYDVNSMYPFVMRNEFPLGKPVRTRIYQEGKIGFYLIRANVPVGTNIPFIPYISDAGKLLFPVGVFDSYVTNVEIEELKRQRIEYRVKDGYYFQRKGAIFKDYVDFYYEIKRNAPKGSASAFAAKNALNHLYGKFGQRRDKEEIIKVEKYEDIVKLNLRPYFEELGLYKKEKHSESDFILPHLASYVTSLARMELYKLIQAAGESNVWYCDTDSIITSNKMPTGEGLGELKLEHQLKEAVFLQPKVYSLITDEGKNICRMKGFNKQEIPFSIFKRIVNSGNLEEISVKISRMCGFKESLNKFGRVIPTRIEHDKTMRARYDKRLIKSDFSTVPININE